MNKNKTRYKDGRGIHMWDEVTFDLGSEESEVKSCGK
jgi:hypothetical protein